MGLREAKWLLVAGVWGKGERKRKTFWKSKERRGEARKEDEGLYNSGPRAVGMSERKSAILSSFHAVRLMRTAFLKRV